MSSLLLTLFLLQQPTPPAQPIPFSHQAHMAIPMACTDCHTMPDPGEVITMPAVSKCMACHRTIKAESPAIQELRAYADQKKQIPWRRVYEIPSWVTFSHKTHAANKCDACHGPVAERAQLFRETDLSMKGCMECHKTRKATLDCGGCHELKN